MPGSSFKPGEKRPRDFSVPSLAQRAVTLVLPATNFAWAQVPTKCPRVQEPWAVVTQTELCPIRPLIKKNSLQLGKREVPSLVFLSM